MSKTNNNLIFITTILAFVFGLSLVSPAYAYDVETGVRFTPNYDSNYNGGGYYPSYNNQGNQNYTTPAPITNVRNYNTYNTVNPTAPATNNNSTDKNTVSKNNTKDTVATSDINESYGSLSANALLGSNSFMPSGLIQWIFLIMLVVAIIFLWRYVHHSEEKYMSEPLKHA